MTVFLLAAILFAGTDDLLQYDDGIPCWYSFNGSYRGTWFSLEDFYGPSIAGWDMQYAQIWFFHVSIDPWDTSMFIGEITDGPPEMPGTVFSSDTYAAAHLSAVDMYPLAPCTTGTEFTVTEISAFSANGSPSVASDLSPSVFGRSFSVETPGVIELWSYDYLIRVYGTPVFETPLGRVSWGSLKSTFSQVN